MRKVILNLAVSLDGYIARMDGSVDWLDHLDTDGSDLGFAEFLNKCDTILMGRKSYEDTLKLGNGEWPYKNMKTFVFTSKTLKDTKNIIFTTKSPSEVIENIQKQLGKDIWLFGGSRFIQSMRYLNLIDEYIITTIPKMIGEGIGLFQDVDIENELELINVEKCKNIVQSCYKVMK